MVMFVVVVTLKQSTNVVSTCGQSESKSAIELSLKQVYDPFSYTDLTLAAGTVTCDFSTWKDFSIK